MQIKKMLKGTIAITLIALSVVGIQVWASGGYKIPYYFPSITTTSSTATSNFAGDVFVKDMGLYPPSSESMDYPNETIITTFQPGHGWAKSYTGGTFSDDTSDFIIGTQSAKMNTPANTVTNMRKTSITPTIDLSQKNVKLLVKFDKASNVTSSSFYASSDNFTNYISCNIKNLINRSDTSGVWVPLTFSLSNTTSGCSVTGTPNYSAINSFQITASSTEEINVNVNKLSYFDKPKEGIVSITLDDGWATQYTTALKYMATSSIPATAYIIPSAIGTENYMTLTQLKELQDIHGWDISAHLSENLTSVSTSSAESLLLSAKNYLLKNGLSKGADSFAYPNGAYNEHTILPLVKKYFRSARTIEEYPETLPAYDPYKLRIYNITASDATTTVQTAITNAKTNKEWLILVFHGIGSNPDIQNNTEPLKFQAIIDTVVSSGIKTQTISEVLNQRNPNTLELSNGKLTIGTTTQSSFITATAGTSATSTIEFGDRYSATSKTCFNIKQADGSVGSFYFAGGAIVVETALCK